MTVEPIYWRKWVFPTKKKCSGAQGRRWSIARSPLDNSCLRRTPDFSLKATVKIYHIDVLLSDISSRISCKNVSLPAMNLIPEKNTFWNWESESDNIFFRSNFPKNSRQKQRSRNISIYNPITFLLAQDWGNLQRDHLLLSKVQGRHSLRTSRYGVERELFLDQGWCVFTFDSGAPISVKKNK